MRILNISDFHLSGELRESKISALRQAVAERDFDMLVFAGDIFHQCRVGGGAVPAQRLVADLEQALTMDRPVVMLEGNHDLMGTQHSALDFLHMPNLIKVKDEPLWMGFEDTEIVFLPWIRNRPDYKEFVLGKLNHYKGTKQHRLLIGHMCIVDATMNQSHKVNADDYFSFGLRELQRNLFKPTSLLAGHLHHRQALGGDFGAYVGGFTQNNFGEGQHPQGYAYWEDGRIEYRDVKAPRFLSLTEQEYLSIPEDQRWEFYRFATEQPERYRDLPNVKPLTFEAFSAPETAVDGAYRNDISMRDLIREYCEATQVEIPPGKFVLEELEKLELNICRSQTGFSRLNSISMANYGPKNNIIHKSTNVEFEDGMIAVVGPNGSGKSLLLESLLAGLYGSYVQRGALKNFLEAPGASLSLSVNAQGSTYRLTHQKAPKGLLSTFNDTSCNLRSEVSSLVDPVFGDVSVFQAVVYMDQMSKKDLVEAEEAKRIEIFRSLLNLEFLDTYRETYNKELKALKQAQQMYSTLSEQRLAVLARLERLTGSAAEIDTVDQDELTGLRETHARLTKNAALLARLREYRAVVLEHGRLLAKVEGFNTTEILERRSLLYRKQAELEQMKQVVKGAQVGCAPNYLPCSFLKTFSGEKLAKLEGEVKALAVSQEESEVLADWTAAGRLLNKMNSLWSSDLEGLTPEDEDVNLSALSAQISLLTQAAQHKKTITKEIEQAQAEIEQLEHKMSRLDTQQERIRELEFLTGLCDKKGLQLYIISSITRELQKILDELCGICDNGLRLKISMAKKEQLDSFQIQYSYKGSEWASVVPCASGGQLTMLKVVFKLGLMIYLNKFFGNYQVLIMDEPEKGLDRANVEVLLTLLQALRDRFTQIVIVTHNDYITQIANQVVKVG